MQQINAGCIKNSPFDDENNQTKSLSRKNPEDYVQVKISEIADVC